MSYITLDHILPVWCWINRTAGTVLGHCCTLNLNENVNSSDIISLLHYSWGGRETDQAKEKAVARSGCENREPPLPFLRFFHQQMSPPVSLLNLTLPLTLFFSPSHSLWSAVCPHILWIFVKLLSEFLSGRRKERGRHAWCCVSAFWLQLCFPFALNLSRFLPSSHMRSVQKYTGTVG